MIQRHGVPDTGNWEKILSKEMPKWIKVYNEAGVKEDYSPCSHSVSHVKNSFVVCSTLQRSRHSAKLLQVNNAKSYSLFCEVELPVINIPFVKFTPHVWSMIFRVFWFVGISKKTESKAQIAKRVSLACKTLEELAQKHTQVHLVGHGIMNRLIAQQLLKSGWKSEEVPEGKKYYGFSYWEYSEFRK